MAKKKKGFLAWLSGLFSSGKKPKRKKRSTKTPSKKSTAHCKRRSDVRKIYKTTDGYFTRNTMSKKPRRVAVIKQRKDDGALAVCKIYSKDGKEGSHYVQDLTLFPKKHKSLTEDSIVGSVPIVGVKDRETKVFAPIFKGDFEPTKDKLTKKEHQAILDGLGGGNAKHKKTHEDLLKNWENHFKK